MAENLTPIQKVGALNNHHTRPCIKTIRPLQWNHGMPVPPVNIADANAGLHMPRNYIVGAAATPEQMLEHPYLQPHAGVLKNDADLTPIQVNQKNLAKRAKNQFMNEPCSHGTVGNRTWKTVFDTIILKVHWLVLHPVDMDTQNHEMLANANEGGCRVKSNALIFLKDLVAYIVGKEACGPHAKLTSLRNLATPPDGNNVGDHASLQLKRSLIHVCVVRPALIFFLETMNPNKDIKYDDLMNTTLSKVSIK